MRANRRIGRLLIALLLLWPALPQAQGFAALGTQAEGFALPAPNPTFTFPKDHAAHPDFRIEWWYVTGNLTGSDGTEYGIQWTLFRSALAPYEASGWDSPQIWMGHAALTSARDHRFAERFGRGGTGAAGTTAQPFAAWIDDWHMRSTAPTSADALDALHLTARGADFTYALDLTAHGPLVRHGANGFSVKSLDGRASYYYAQPFYSVTGQIETPDGATPVTGTAWLDREWSSQPLAADQHGWDWMALTFIDGSKLMAAQLRDNGPGYRIGSLIAADGHVTPLSDDQITLTPGRTARITATGTPNAPAQSVQVPVQWAIQVPQAQIDITLSALNPQAWVGASTAYWEGPVAVSGSHLGRGYLEMTGYDTPPPPAEN